MIQVMKMVRHSSRLSLDAFRQWWPQEIGQRVLRVGGGLRRYVLSMAVPADGADGSGAIPSSGTFHGLSQMWFVTEQAARAFLASAAYQEVLAAESEGVDPAGSVEFLSREHVIFEDVPLRRDTRMITLVCGVKRKPEMDVRAFQDYYLNRHIQYATLHEGLRAYYQHHVLESQYAHGDPAFDGITLNWCDDRAALARMLVAPTMERGVADAREFCDMSKLMVFTADDHRLLWPA